VVSVFFFSKCSFFYNSNLFGSCFIHISYTECAKIKKNNNSGAKRLIDTVLRSSAAKILFTSRFSFLPFLLVLYLFKFFSSSPHPGRQRTSPNLLTKQHSSRHESTNLGVDEGAEQIAVGCYQTCKCKSKSLLVEVNEIAPDAKFSEKTVITLCEAVWRRFPLPRCLMRGSVSTRLLGLRVCIPQSEWKLLSCESITRRGESYWVWSVRTISKPWQRGALDPVGLSCHEEEEENEATCREG